MLTRTVQVLILFAFCATDVSGASILPDRAALEVLLGSGAVSEDFNLDLGGAPVLDVDNPFDSSNGPIVDGVVLTGVGGGLRIRDRTAIGGSPALEVTGSGDRSLLVDFTTPVRAMGFDFLPFVLNGTEVRVKVFAADDVTEILSFSTFAFFSFGEFIGAEDALGIGSVTVSASANPPLDFVKEVTIDDLTFGQGSEVPEPATATLIVSGLAIVTIRKRRCRLRSCSDREMTNRPL